MRLRFAGPEPVSFATLSFEVAPGDEFEVPDEAAPGFLARSDVQAAPDPLPARRRPAKSPAAAPTDSVEGGSAMSGVAPVPDVTEEVDRGVSDDH